MKIYSVFLVIILLISNDIFSQMDPFEISIKPIEIEELSGIQSYAFGQNNGKWLIVGGRLDGLHQRQPWASFDIDGHNNQLFVIDPVSRQKWSAPLSSLPPNIQEHLSSTNMEFYQEGDYLYCIGGYGFSNIADDHITYANLTAIKIPDVIEAVITNNNFNDHFRQITDSLFQVTGGQWKKINDVHHLLGGQKFIGMYNPMGPDHGPGFIQEYTNAIRKFALSDDETTITITHLPSHFDTTNLHRRDYNAESQILPNGDEGISMFSGVFQHSINLPFLNSVTIDSNGYTVNNSFQQHYNHYHCPVIPLYSEIENTMHNVFFGGIAQFYDNAGTLVQDNNVPFVNTIARVSRDVDGNMSEFKLPVEMPALLGAGAEFIPNLDLAHFENEVFKLDSISTDSVLIGHIFGGISSTQANIFFINDGTQSQANNQLFEVYIKKSLSVSVDQLMPSSISPLNLIIYPNPSDGFLNISFDLTQKDDVSISIYAANGALVESILLSDQNAGNNLFRKEISSLTYGSIYLISLETSTEKTTQLLIVEK